MENILLIDWLSITTKELDALGFQKLLGMENVPWETINGQHGYQDRLYFSGISIHFNGRKDMGVWLEMSGQGCRTYESLGSGDFERLFDFVLSGHGNITRLDVAYDDHSGLLDISQLEQDAKAGNIVSRFRKYGAEWERDRSGDGVTVKVGSQKSDIYLRIYDKAVERHCHPGTHWIRVELQLRRDRARKFIELDGDYGERFSGVLANYVRFVEPLEEDTNKWRWPMKAYWADFLGDAVRISLYEKPGMEYNIDHLENYVFRQAGNAIDAALQIFGIRCFLDKLKDRHTIPNPKYKQLVDKLFHLGQQFEDVPADRRFADDPFF